MILMEEYDFLFFMETGTYLRTGELSKVVSRLFQEINTAGVSKLQGMVLRPL